MFISQFKRLIEEIEEAPTFSELETKKQAQIWDWNIAPTIRAWGELANECDNKHHWNNYAKHVLKEICKLNEIMKEAK
tara:strand:- start:310 stop:543 length:234 start_codon:yes stop_codon:yes gene_type:complete